MLAAFVKITQPQIRHRDTHTHTRSRATDSNKKAEHKKINNENKCVEREKKEEKNLQFAYLNRLDFALMLNANHAVVVRRRFYLFCTHSFAHSSPSHFFCRCRDSFRFNSNWNSLRSMNEMSRSKRTPLAYTHTHTHRCTVVATVHIKYVFGCGLFVDYYYYFSLACRLNTWARSERHRRKIPTVPTVIHFRLDDEPLLFFVCRSREQNLKVKMMKIDLN